MIPLDSLAEPAEAPLCLAQAAPDGLAARLESGAPTSSTAASSTGSPTASESQPLRRRHVPPSYIMEPFMRASQAGARRSAAEDALALAWLPGVVFAGAEALAFLGLRKSIFVALTDGAFELGARYAAVVEVHVWASIAMWSLGAAQVFGERIRRRPETAWVHRRGGEAMLGVYLLVVFPTALYLTVLQRIDYATLAVGAVLMDTAVCTTYFLVRGWRVGRLRRNAKSLSLHGKLMQCGLLMSMSILPQRFLQLYLTAQYKLAHQLTYTISILTTSILFVLFGHLVDGPRGGIWLASIGQENAEEAYGTATARPLEKWAWRTRWFTYMFLHGLLRHLCEADAQAAAAAAKPAPGGGQRASA